jgi:hypothetical protein
MIAATNAYPLELNFGQEVIHSDLQFLNYDLVDIHKLTPKIQEVMKFQRWLIVKVILEKFPSLKIGLYSSVWSHEINTFQAQDFFADFHTCRTTYEEHFLFWKCDHIRFQ